jgi:hypothetical protein
MRGARGHTERDHLGDVGAAGAPLAPSAIVGHRAATTAWRREDPHTSQSAGGLSSTQWLKINHQQPILQTFDVLCVGRASLECAMITSALRGTSGPLGASVENHERALLESMSSCTVAERNHRLQSCTTAILVCAVRLPTLARSS